MSDIYEYETKSGATRYVRARWDAEHAQFVTCDVRAEVRRHVTGYVYTFARTIAGLVALGARTYATIEAAKARS